MARLPAIPVSRSLSSIRSCPRNTILSTHAQQRRLYAGQSYGGGQGDPKGENPQDQGPNPSADLEHPGPPPPSVGQGTGGGPTKKGANGHNTAQNGSNGEEGGGSSKGGGNGAKPKIHNDNAPPEHEQSDEVRAHNKDMEKRHDRAEERSLDSDGKDDNVDKGFWKGQGGADNNP
ncbi:hypothetical protein MMC28_000831 [Mycoblastus sanguinarius]|nr:hypothetical protein [Mycoblastus sanguinarius]